MKMIYFRKIQYYYVEEAEVVVVMIDLEVVVQVVVDNENVDCNYY